jgi:molybdate transport system substrate-binding protein
MIITLKSLRIFLIGCFLAFASSAHAGDIHVSAGVGLRDMVTAICDAYKVAHPEVNIRFNFAAAGPLAKQIEAGAPADIVIPAHTKWMNYLVARNKVNGKTVRIFAGNGLVVAGLGKKKLGSLNDLTAMNRIAIGTPGSVPVGDYAVQSFKAAGIYENLVSHNKLVMASDVRQALIYADRGEADVAVVCITDVMRAERAGTLYTIPDSFHEKIVYTIGLTLTGDKNTDARSLYDHIASDDATKIIVSQGFDVSSRGARVPSDTNK